MSDPLPPDQIPSRPRVERPLEHAFKPAQRWLGERQVIVALLAVTIISLVLALWFSLAVVTESKRKTWVVLLDDSGAYTVAPASMEDPNSKIFTELAMQGAELSLKRNPSGLSYPEFAENLFADLAARDVMSHIASGKDDRLRRNLYDSPEIEKVEKIDQNNREMAYRVLGVIIRSGALDGQPIREIGKFRMYIKMIQQPRLRERGRYPFAVSQWAVKIDWDDGSREEWGNGLDKPRK